MICAEGGVGDPLQPVNDIKADIETGALRDGEHIRDGSEGLATARGAQMQPFLTTEGDRTHVVLTRSARPAGSLSAVHQRCNPVRTNYCRF